MIDFLQYTYPKTMIKLTKGTGINIKETDFSGNFEGFFSACLEVGFCSQLVGLQTYAQRYRSL